MALPALRAGILLTTAAAATGTLLYEHHEPFRTWADDVSGRAQAAWVGIKEEIRELKDDIEGHARRQREAPYGGRTGQWEGMNARGSWRRGRGRRSSDANGDVQRATATDNWQGEGQLRRRRGSVRDSSLDPEKIAREALDSDAILSSPPSGLHSRASTETMRSAQEEALHEAAHEQNILTPTTSASTNDADDNASISVISAPSGASTPGDIEILTPTDGSEAGVMTPTSGMMTPTSSTADELIDFDELRRQAEDERSETLGRDEVMEDARSEVSDWSNVSGEAARLQNA